MQFYRCYRMSNVIASAYTGKTQSQTYLKRAENYLTKSYRIHQEQARIVQFLRPFSNHHPTNSGHSRWSKIKHDKGKTDARKANEFSKVAEEITEYTKRDGPDPRTNPRLKTILDKAKKSGMSGSSIENALKRGQGLSISGKPLETVFIEGMTQSGVAFIIECNTDNKLRTLQDIRLIIRDSNGKLAPTQYLFVRQPFMHLTGPEDLPPEEQTAILEEPVLSIPVEQVALIPGERSTWEVRVEYSEPPLQLVEEVQNLLPSGWSVVKTGMRYYASEIFEVDDDNEAGYQLRDFLEKILQENDVTEIYTNMRWKSTEPVKYAIL